MNSKRIITAAFVALLLAVASGTAWASNSSSDITSVVTWGSGQIPTAISPVGATPGNIFVDYSWTTSGCTVGTVIGTLNLTLTDTGGSGNYSSYSPAGIPISLAQTGGGTPIGLSANPGTLYDTGLGWSGSATVTVTVANCPGDFSNGSTLDGQMNMSTPHGSGLNTPTTPIHVHVHAVVPVTGCLMPYSFQTNQDTGDPLGSVVVVAGGRSGTAVRSTSPGQASADALVVNTCASPYTFDLAVGLDPEWQTNPNNNPGNATFTYLSGTELDPSNFSLITSLINSGTGTPQHQALCLQNVTLANGDSFLTTVHSAINTGYSGGLTTSLLPSDGDFDFNATIFLAGSGCATAFPTGVITALQDSDDVAGPATATSDLTFTVSH